MSKNTQISELINYISVNESGNVVFTTVPAATTNTDKFLVSDSGVLKFRTAAQLLSDIGAQASGSYQAALSGTGFVKISGSTISYDNSTYALDSAVVKLTGAQTIAGIKTFQDDIKASNFLYIREQNASTLLANHTQVYANSTYFGFTNGAGTGSAIFTYNGARNYTLPNASGTLALTSNLGAYLPLAGGTLTGALNGTTATMGIANVQNWNTISTFARFGHSSYNTGTNYGYLQDSSGNVFVEGTTVNLSTTAGNVTNIGGALNGTSASFTGAFELNTTGTGAIGFFGANNTTDKYIRIRNSSGNFEMGTSSTEHYLIGNGAIPLKFFTSGTSRLTIASTGQATFTSGVEAKKALFGVSGVSTPSLIVNDNDQSNVRLRLQNSTSGQAWDLIGGLNAANNTDFSIYDVANNNTVLRIVPNSGVATFSSSVSATIFTSAGGRGTSFGFRLPDWQIYNTSSGNGFAINNYATDVLTLASTGAATFTGNTTGPIAAFTNTNTAGTGNGILVNVNSQLGTDNYVMNLISNGISRMYVREDGNVGIGTDSPSTTLNVGHPNHGLGIAYLGGSSLPAIAGLFTDISSGQQGYGSLLIKSRTDFANYSINFYTAGTANNIQERMRIFADGNVFIGSSPSNSGSRLRINGNLQVEGFQRMYTYFIIVNPSTTGTITISSPTGSNMQGSMQVMAGGYGNGITGNITGLWLVGGLLFFNNASTSSITQIVNSVTEDGFGSSMSFQRSSDQYTVTLTNNHINSQKTFYVSVVINGS